MDALTALLRYDFVLDTADHLNVGLMREGRPMHASHHNVSFAADVLNAIADRPADQLTAPIELLPSTPVWRKVVRFPEMRRRQPGCCACSRNPGTGSS